MSLVCSVCASSRLDIVGFRGLGFVLQCQSCGSTTIEKPIESESEGDHSLDGIDPDMYNQNKAAEVMIE